MFCGPSFVSKISTNSSVSNQMTARDYLLWQSGGFESSSGRQNKVSIGPTVPTDFEWYLYRACCGTVLCLCTCRVRGNETVDKFARGESVLKFVGPELVLGVCRQDIRRRVRRWLVNQNWVWWRGLSNTKERMED